MAKENQIPVEPPVPERPADIFMEESFIRMGYTMPFPKSLVSIHNSMKKRKDRIHPGRLSPEAFAIIATISDLIEGKFEKE